jgi:hypothetical protein
MMKVQIINIGNQLRNITMAAMGLIFSLSLSAQSGTITHSPAYVEAQVGEPFEVTVNINPGGEPVSVIDLHMRFNPAFLEVVSLEALQGNLGNMMIAPSFNNEEGTITMGAFDISTNLPVSEFPMLKITFMGIASTEGTFVAHPSNIFPKSIMAYAGENQLNSVGPLDITILGGVVLSVADLNQESMQMDLWPNPARNEAFVTFQSINTGFTSIELCDLTGQVVSTVYHGSLASGVKHTFEVDLQNLSDGMYLCRIINDNDILVKRLVIVR